MWTNAEISKLGNLLYNLNDSVEEFIPEKELLAIQQQSETAFANLRNRILVPKVLLLSIQNKIKILRNSKNE